MLGERLLWNLFCLNLKRIPRLKMLDW